MTALVCYCFGYSDADIIEDVLKNNGLSAIMERMMTEKKTGGCQCHIKNPTGK